MVRERTSTSHHNKDEEPILDAPSTPQHHSFNTMPVEQLTPDFRRQFVFG
jgi:hypothetical protein